jgi:hypothetical protein
MDRDRRCRFGSARFRPAGDLARTWDQRRAPQPHDPATAANNIRSVTDTVRLLLTPACGAPGRSVLAGAWFTAGRARLARTQCLRVDRTSGREPGNPRRRRRARAARPVGGRRASGRLCVYAAGGIGSTRNRADVWELPEPPARPVAPSTSVRAMTVLLPRRHALGRIPRTCPASQKFLHLPKLAA